MCAIFVLVKHDVTIEGLQGLSNVFFNFVNAIILFCMKFNVIIETHILNIALSNPLYRRILK